MTLLLFLLTFHLPSICLRTYICSFYVALLVLKGMYHWIFFPGVLTKWKLPRIELPSLLQRLCVRTDPHGCLQVLLKAGAADELRRIRGEVTKELPFA